MLNELSADEFVGWQAYERLEPFGFPWQDWIQSAIRTLLDHQLNKVDRRYYRDQEALRWQPPEPLFVTRLKDQSRHE